MHYATALFTVAVAFGVLVMALNHPDKTNGLFAAGATSIDGVTKALEGR